MGLPSEAHIGNVKYFVYFIWVIFFIWMNLKIYENKQIDFLNAIFIMVDGLIVLYVTILWAQMKDPII